MSLDKYIHSDVEDKIYSYWEKNNLFKPKYKILLSSNDKYLLLFSLVLNLVERYPSSNAILGLFYSLALSCPLPYPSLPPRRIEGTTRSLSPRSLSLSMETQVGDRTHNFNHATRLSH